jgi:hypothetical protein
VVEDLKFLSVNATKILGTSNPPHEADVYVEGPMAQATNMISHNIAYTIFRLPAETSG